MKSFIDKIFRAKKQKEILDEIIHTEVIQENKEILSKQIETSIKKPSQKKTLVYFIVCPSDLEWVPYQKRWNPWAKLATESKEISW